jgi:hypothetical protein
MGSYFTLYTQEKIFRNTVGKSGVVVIIYAQISARSAHGCVGGTVANWPIFRPQNSKPAQQNCLQPRKFSGLESGLIPKMRPNFIVM